MAWVLSFMWARTQVDVIADGALLPLYDARAYWHAWQQDLYVFDVSEPLNRYLYSPVFAQLLWPLTLLAWPAFAALWLVGLAGVAWWLVRPLRWWWKVPALLALGFGDYFVGNVHLLFAAVLVLGRTRSWLWSFVLLTKPMTGVIGLWHLVCARRWRALVVASSVTAAVSAVSFVVSPRHWQGWYWLLFDSGIQPRGGMTNYVVRFGLAVVVAAVAARLGRDELLPVAVCLALPVWVPSSLAVLLAVPRLVQQRRQAQGVRRDPAVPEASLPVSATV